MLVMRQTCHVQLDIPATPATLLTLKATQSKMRTHRAMNITGTNTVIAIALIPFRGSINANASSRWRADAQSLHSQLALSTKKPWSMKATREPLPSQARKRFGVQKQLAARKKLAAQLTSNSRVNHCKPGGVASRSKPRKTAPGSILLKIGPI